MAEESDTHRHECDECGCVWQHTRAPGQPLPLEAHRCPRCRILQGFLYYGDKPAEFVDHHLRSQPMPGTATCPNARQHHKSK